MKQVVFVIAYLLSTLALADPVSLPEQVEKINTLIRTNNRPLPPLLKDEVKEAIKDFLPFSFLRPLRAEILLLLEKDLLPEKSYLDIESFHESHSSRISVFFFFEDGSGFALPIKINNRVLLYTKTVEAACDPKFNAGVSICDEPFVDLPKKDAPSRPKNTDIRVTPIVVPGQSMATPTQRDALKVEVKLTNKNLDDVAAYFGTGFGRQEVLERASAFLGSQKEAWIEVQELWPNWIGNKVNTFPTETDNDVCHAPAREFFFENQTPVQSRNARDTQAIAAVLTRFYCPLESSEGMTFGDFLWVPAEHSGRFILTDPKSKRDVSFSVNSGGNVPYRFYWMDEDFSTHPYSHMPDSSVRSIRVDVWRRCR